MDFTITLPHTHQTMTLSDLLEKEWLVPRKVRHFLRTRKDIQINGETALFHQETKAGDQITLHLEDSDYAYQDVHFGNAKLVDILYEDEHLIIVNKPVGIKTHPNEPSETDTMFNHLAAYLNTRPYVVHRLDKETSGALLFAKNPFVLPILSRLLEEKQIYRHYHAIVHGRLTRSQTIRQKIGRDRHDRKKQVVDPRNGKNAVTHVSIEQTQANTTKVSCVLETGRTHQIRVHLAHIGHPIVGDPLYQKKFAKRLMLHAYEMHFIHPFISPT